MKPKNKRLNFDKLCWCHTFYLGFWLPMLLPEKHLTPNNLLSWNSCIWFSSQYFLKFYDHPVDLTLLFIDQWCQRPVKDWGQELHLPLPCQTSSVGEQQISVSSSCLFKSIIFTIKSFLSVFSLHSFVSIFICIYCISNIWMPRSQVSA